MRNDSIYFTFKYNTSVVVRAPLVWSPGLAALPKDKVCTHCSFHQCTYFVSCQELRIKFFVRAVL